MLQVISELTGETVDMDDVRRVLDEDNSDNEEDENDQLIYVAAFVYDHYAVEFSNVFNVISFALSKWVEAGKPVAAKSADSKKSDKPFDPSKLRINAFSAGDIVDIHNGLNVPKDLRYIIDEAEIYLGAKALDPSAKRTEENLDIAEKLLILKPGDYSRMVTVASNIAYLESLTDDEFHGSIGKYIINRDKEALDRPVE